jgi:hypothetical protein
MKKGTSTPNLPMSSRMQMAGGAKEMPKVMPKKGATKKIMSGAAKKAMPSKKGY